MPPKKDTATTKSQEEQQQDKETDERVSQLEKALAAAEEKLQGKASEINELQEKLYDNETHLKKCQSDLNDLRRDSQRIETLERELDHISYNYKRETNMREDAQRALKDAEDRLSQLYTDTRWEQRHSALPTVPSQQHSSNHLGGPRAPPHIIGRPKHDVPLPRQMVFNGSESWESFVQSFKSLSVSCEWDDTEKLFRLKSSLRGEAAEYVFTQLPDEFSLSYNDLVTALESRYKERRTIASYLAELESRKLGHKEKLNEYVCDIQRLVIKGFPTADALTRETIGLRYFIKGLQDPQMAVAIGMQNPTSMAMARAAVENYNSLREEASKVPRPRVNALMDNGAEVATASGETHKRLDQLENNIAELISLMKQDRRRDYNYRAPRRRQSEIQCFKCREMGHIARNCPNDVPSDSTEQHQAVSQEGNE